MPYIPNTDADRAEMLAAAGFASVDEMWEKAGVKFPAPALDGIPEGKSEFEVMSYLSGLAEMNATHLINFVGGGYYDPIIPAAAD
ncbi:MAG: glycine dehydrogenase, partial [Lentisphaeria bacterium]|nr:glycine dehydrogenase [Lentisphaeria bacterium]